MAVSRVLFRHSVTRTAAMTIRLGHPLPGISSGLPESSSRRLSTPRGAVHFRYDLAPGGVYRPRRLRRRPCALTARFHPYAAGSRSHRGRGLLSVALSLRLPSPAVSRHPAVWSPDFPPTPDPGKPERAGGHLATLAFAARRVHLASVCGKGGPLWRIAATFRRHDSPPPTGNIATQPASG